MLNVCALGHPAHIPTVIQLRPDVQFHVSINVRLSSSDVFLQCLRCWHWGYMNFVLHITSQGETAWLEIWRPDGAMATEKHHPDQRALSRDMCIAASLYGAATGLPSSEHASHEAGF
ncbi:hypothetical protein AVEN_70963-1 [Araneus ventricosus]|uniref:Uncharacterized protein n=1 Tax=Araneus ventricosus TaxID=182803 RepID=A0A4Y2CQ70_ARAVE|nr:hypothetical protein AVEN_70963-1 [Araneus ventricosus]